MPHPNSVTLETTPPVEAVPPVEAARDREAVGRAAQAVAEAVRIAWWTAVHLLRYVFVGCGADRTVRLAVLLRGYLLRMGPLYIKAEQVLGTRSRRCTGRCCPAATSWR
jgi:glutamate-1-semialdehyde 2,1-aminomutase